MISGIVKRMMQGTIERLSQREQVTPTQIGVFIHTKKEDLSPQYFYTVDGKVKKDADGNQIELNFKKDILDAKIDFMQYGAISSNFLKSFFQSTSEHENVHPQLLYIQIGCYNNETKELALVLRNKSLQMKTLTLEELFGE